MHVQQLAAEDFRNFTQLRVLLHPGINVVSGANANGKTNFIEALYFCATGRSQRASQQRELVRFGQREAHLQAVVAGEGEAATLTIDAHLFADGKKRGIALDHVPLQKLSQLYGVLPVVIFTPEDLRLVKAGPAERRAFVDMELCQLNAVYYHNLRQYHQALKQRNRLLKAIPKQRNLLDTLPVWDEPLRRYGTLLMARRQIFVAQLSDFAGRIHSALSGGESLALTYRPHVPDPDTYAERLQRSRDRDLALGSTSVGIHKDDLCFTVNGTDLRTYGSQGQQRTAALAAKLAEIELIRAHSGRTPVLLLDDVLSELDESRQSFLFQHMQEGTQTILTCTGVEDLLRKIKPDRMLKMQDGQIRS